MIISDAPCGCAVEHDTGVIRTYCTRHLLEKVSLALEAARLKLNGAAPVGFPPEQDKLWHELAEAGLVRAGHLR